MADERFSGDMSRNEVEIDLNKFMELVTENSNLKAEILKLESEKEPENPYQRWIWLSKSTRGKLSSRTRRNICIPRNYTSVFIENG